MKIIISRLFPFLTVAVLIILFQHPTGADPLITLTGFEPVNTINVIDSNGVTRTIYRYNYLSDALRIRCEVAFPSDFKPDGCPALVLCHGGIDGIYPRMRVKALELADMGYLVAMPAYRGEDGSDGQIEIAVGEVDDVLACVNLVRNSPGVDKNRIAVIGTSHGALIAAFAGARDPSIPAIVSAYGVMDIHTWWQFLIDTGQYDWNDELSVKIYGNGPDDKPGEFAMRSGVMHACEINQPLMIVQGSVDRLVPVSQAESMVKAFDECGKKNYVYNVYDGVGHGFVWFTKVDEHRRGASQVNLAYQAWEDILGFVESCWRND